MKLMKAAMINFAINHARTVAALLVAATLAAGVFLPGVELDTDPENMLEQSEPVRIFHNQTKEEFGLSDTVVVGVVNDTHPDGVYNVDTLGHVWALTEFAKTLWWEDNENPGSYKGVIEADMIAPSLIDHISQAGPGTIRFEYLMPGPPATREEALKVRERIMSNPMLRGMVGSGDGKGLCIYLPLTDKLLSYKVYTALNEKIKGFNAGDTYHITGLPVAEGAIGVEMFSEMKVASPLAMLVVLGLLLLFFRKWSLVMLPMVIATVSIVISMGLMIGLGFEVHILSSMLPIFLMSISIVDCIHVLSEFFDVYTPERGRKEAVREVLGTLFTPMLYTSLTTAAGFLSLTLTSIPPARIFGLFLCFGVMLAWLCTVMFVPAYIVLMPEKTFRNFGLAAGQGRAGGRMTRFLGALGRFTAARRGMIFAGLGLAALLAVAGISQTRINDNYSKRFAISHPLRRADIALNSHFSGTYTAYLVLEGPRDDSMAAVKEAGQAFSAYARVMGETDDRIPGMAARIAPLIAPVAGTKKGAEDGHFLDRAVEFADTMADSAPDDAWEAWQILGDFLRSQREKTKVFKQPGVLSYMAGLQRHLESEGLVGKASSVADIVSKVNQELTGGSPENYTIPDTLSKVGECYMQFQQGHRPQDLWHRVTPDFSSANIMLQMASGNSMDMAAVVNAVADYLAVNPPPVRLEHNWAGLHYVNLFFQNKMFWEMLWAFVQSFVVVLVMMTLLFRSLKWGVLCMVPLSVTIAAIYGTVGLMGKDYDMPVAVISVLSIGIAVDFAIHFLERSRKAYEREGSWQRVLPLMFGEPARAISRNVMVIAVGFLPLILARLVPYKITGLMLCGILSISGIVTLLALPALLGALEPFFFREKAGSPKAAAPAGENP
ncbi:MAG: MMPL family transporter [Desulfobacter sp.]|nr:MAG: MMPL family transporter [Desulfobacter sp.]